MRLREPACELALALRAHYATRLIPWQIPGASMRTCIGSSCALRDASDEITNPFSLQREKDVGALSESIKGIDLLETALDNYSRVAMIDSQTREPSSSSKLSGHRSAHCEPSTAGATEAPVEATEREEF